MADWATFGLLASALAVGFVWLARASAGAMAAQLDAIQDGTAEPASGDRGPDSELLVANTLASHGLLLAVVLGVVWYTGVPLEPLGLAVPTPTELGTGVAVGLGLALANAGGARLATRVGIDHDDRLRALLAPTDPQGWATLLVVALPLVAAAEELLFRGVLVGAFAAGFELPVWALAVVSSLLFGLGHGLQGPGGVAVTTGLGAVLAASFVLTGSLAVVVVAHYVVNVAEFVANEGPVFG